MAKKLPLSLRLIFPLVTMQIVATAIGFFWFTSWFERSRTRELEHILDTQTDAIEDAIVFRNGGPRFEIDGELVGELNADKNYYFAIISPDGALLQETQGAAPMVREKIRSQLTSLNVHGEKIDSAMVDEYPWRVMRETIDAAMLNRREKTGVVKDDEKPIGYLYAAINTAPMMGELAFAKRAIIIGTIVISSLIAFGTAIIVSRMTSNLKKFVQSLEGVNPEKPMWKPPSEASSLEEKMLFARFQEMMAEIRKATETRRLFIANASHELKTPVAGMLMALEVMLSKRRSQDEYEAVGQKLLRTVKNLKRLTTALLDLASISDAAEIDKMPVEISELFNALLIRWKPFAARKNIALALAPDAQPVTIMSNYDLLEVAISNFIDNSIKYTNDGGMIELFCGTEVEKNVAILRIKDSGVGMSGDDVKKLGQVFFRSSESRSDEMSYGLGFAQANQIIKLLKGNLEIDSKLGVGTQVSLYFPVDVIS